MARILYFGLARERAGTESDYFDFDKPLLVGAMWDRLIERHPALRDARTISRVAIDMRYASENDSVNNDSEIAIIPPVAGG